MHLEYTVEQQELRAKIRAQLESVMTPERVAAVSRHNVDGPAAKEGVRALAAANLLGVGWPKEYGGVGIGEPGPVPLATGGHDLRMIVDDVGVQQNAWTDSVTVEALDRAPDPDAGAVVTPPVIQRIRGQVRGAGPDARGRSIEGESVRR